MRFEGLLLLAVSLLGIVIYLPTLRNGYVHDDVVVVESNPRITQGLFREALSEPYWPGYGDLSASAPASASASNWRPLATLSLALTHSIAPDSAVLWDHLLNALLHGLLILVLYPLARRFAGAGWPALLAVALFASPDGPDIMADFDREIFSGFSIMLVAAVWLAVLFGLFRRKKVKG